MGSDKHLTRAPLLLVLNISRCSRFVKNDRAAFLPPERENAYEPIDRCIDLLGDHGHLAALAMLIKPIRNKLLGWTS